MDDAEAMAALLARLGFAPAFSFEKRRESWEWDGCHVELDEVPHLGNFVEVEGPDEEHVMRVRAALGLADRPVIQESYVALLMDYLKVRGEKSTDVRFP